MFWFALPPPSESAEQGPLGAEPEASLFPALELDCSAAALQVAVACLASEVEKVAVAVAVVRRVDMSAIVVAMSLALAVLASLACLVCFEDARVACFEDARVACLGGIMLLDNSNLAVLPVPVVLAVAVAEALLDL